MIAVQEEYECTPYDDYIHSQSQPSRLAAVARLLGYCAPDPSRARILDLGCGQGLNLTALAARFPESACLGLDFSAPQISAGREVIAEARLGNIELRREDLLAWDPGGARFDYVICYGVFSWVPEAVKDRILSICAQCLAPGGIACISYMVNPGCKQPEALRSLLMSRCNRFSQLPDKVAAARAVLQFLDRAYESIRTNPHSASWGAHVRHILGKDPNLLFHDDIGTQLDPLYLSEFAARVAHHGLLYLSDSDYGSTLPERLPPELAREIEAMTLDRIEAEQFLDFVTCRTFRVSLVVRQKPGWSPAVDPGAIEDLCVGTGLRPDPDSLSTAQDARFVGATGPSIRLRGEALIGFIQELGRRAPGLHPFREILPAAQAHAGRTFGDEDLCRLRADLIRLYARRRIQLGAVSTSTLAKIPRYPKLSNLNRALVRRRGLVAAMPHGSATVSDEEKAVCALLDGTRTLEEVRTSPAGMALGEEFESLLATLLRTGCLE